GGCDEGPGYWGAAAASLYDNLAMLNQATNNQFQFAYHDEKIRNMARFIYRAQISEKYFLDFADADPQPGMPGNMIYRFGKDIQDNDMMRFGAYYRQDEPSPSASFHFFRNFYSLFMQDEYRHAEKSLPLPENVWLPDIQVMIARDTAGSTKGWFVAAKGGNNDESHNHNDIGNYIVYFNGFPLLIDVGRGSYTAKTFSNRRYDIWFNCSNYHNVPTINGVNQPPGPQFKATNVSYQQGNHFSQLSLDISKSYPDSAAVSTWQRTIRLNRQKDVEVNDIFSLKKANNIIEHLMTCYPAEVGKPGELIIHYQPKDANAKDFVIKFNPKQMSVTVEKVPLVSKEDKGIKEKWGDNIYRINFTMIQPKLKDKIEFVVNEK
ncbi:MAG TPA: heparinase II/III family protein, partial [Ferruginibacter sp.]|nr:heparinase II/III family protein [Ferruginibacter sp.]